MPISDLLKRTGMTSINHMAVKSVLAETFKILQCDTVPDLKTTLTASKVSDYNLRSQQKKNLQNVVPKRSRNKGFLQNSASTWNTLMSEVDLNNMSVKQFKTLTNKVTKKLPL